MPESVAYEFTVEVKDSAFDDDVLATYETTIEASTYKFAYAQLERERDDWIETLDDVEASECVHSVTVAFADTPWETPEDLEAMFRDLESVESARFEHPLDGEYSPPKYHLQTTESVSDDVTDIFPGLTVERDTGGHAEVIVSPAPLRG